MTTKNKPYGSEKDSTGYRSRKNSTGYNPKKDLKPYTERDKAFSEGRLLEKLAMSIPQGALEISSLAYERDPSTPIHYALWEQSVRQYFELAKKYDLPNEELPISQETYQDISKYLREYIPQSTGYNKKAKEPQFRYRAA